MIPHQEFKAKDGQVEAEKKQEMDGPRWGEPHQAVGDTERVVDEKPSDHPQFSEQIAEDQTLLPRTRKGLREKHKSTFHIFWGAMLIILVLFLRRLPRYAGGEVPEEIDEGDALIFWEAKELIGENPHEGLLRRLRENPHVSRSFLDFSQLSKESFDRRGMAAQRIHNFQRQLVQTLNPALAIRDRMNALLKQLPPHSGTTPPNAEALRAQLQNLNAVYLKASSEKAAFLSQRNTVLMAQELFPGALRRVLLKAVKYMHRDTQMLELHINAAMDPDKKGDGLYADFRKELVFREARAEAAFHDLEIEALECLKGLPIQHHWMLLLFVDRLPVRPSESAPLTTP